ncbi:MAG: hypothetical protein Q8Q42_01660 [Nanoarchaeota archaeon]|nr:hypothetical protein [Nanoarchaeota archaeon]
MIYRVLLVMFIFLLCSIFVNAEITEIMYNPEGNDNNREYVEVIFDEGMSMDGWTIKDHTHQDLLLLIEGDGNSRINLIVEEAYSADYFNDLDFSLISVYSVGAAIGNGLSNSGDEVMIYNLDDELVDSASYSSDLANGDGNALCFNSEGYYSCVPSPGMENDETSDDFKDEENKTYFDYPANESEKINESDNGYIRIESIENSDEGCSNLNVRLSLWNNRNKKEEVNIYVLGVDVSSSLIINPQEGQSVEIPVATCNEFTHPEEGERVVVAEGFGEKDMKLIWIGGKDHYENNSVAVKNKPIENNINEDSKVDTTLEETFETRRTIPFGDLTLYLLYLVGGLGAYYVLFKV